MHSYTAYVPGTAVQVNARTHTCVACGLFVNTLYKPQNPSTMLYDGNAASALENETMHRHGVAAKAKRLRHQQGHQLPGPRRKYVQRWELQQYIRVHA